MTTGIDVMHNAQILGEIYINHFKGIYLEKLRRYKKLYENIKINIYMTDIDYHNQFVFVILSLNKNRKLGTEIGFVTS